MSHHFPFVSVLMPVRNEGDFIEKSFESVLLQDYPASNMEIVVADGMSTDNTRNVIAELAAQSHQIMLKILDNPGSIVPTGMNIALRQAKGDVIIRVDGHTLIACDYVRQCVETLERTKADNVGGKMNAIGGNPFSKAVALATSTPFGIGSGRFHYSEDEEWVDTVYMGAWPRRVFEKIGLFDEELVRDQDDEFNYRLRERGGRILLSPAIRSEYTVRSKPCALWQQYYQYGFWKVRVLQKHLRQMRLRQFTPPVFVLALLLSLLATLLFHWGWILLAVIGGSYVLANLATSCAVSARRGWRHLLLLPVCFTILHVSYGLGFLVGLVRFARRWNDRKGKVPEFHGSRI